MNSEAVQNIGSALQNSIRNFDIPGFKKAVIDKFWQERELKHRISHLAHCIVEYSELGYPDLVPHLIEAAPRLDLFACWPLQTVSELFGVEYPEQAYFAMEKITEYASAEFAIRPFLIRYPEKTMMQVLKWSRHENHHVRRLASEGSRPRLPWGQNVPWILDQPEATLPILEQLKNDESEYVRRSVANHLNDITKLDKDLALDTAKKWLRDHDEESMRKLITHAMRWLLKQGDHEAAALFGFHPTQTLTITEFSTQPKKVQKGGKVTLLLKFQLEKAEKLDLILKVYYASPKGVRLFNFNGFRGVRSAGHHEWRKEISLADRSIRKIFSGLHKVDLQINGELKSETLFEVL